MTTTTREREILPGGWVPLFPPSIKVAAFLPPEKFGDHESFVPRPNLSSSYLLGLHLNRGSTRPGHELRFSRVYDKTEAIRGRCL